MIWTVCVFLFFRWFLGLNTEQRLATEPRVAVAERVFAVTGALLALSVLVAFVLLATSSVNSAAAIASGDPEQVAYWGAASSWLFWILVGLLIL